MREHTDTLRTAAQRDADSAPLALIRLIEQQPEMSQRQLSQALGISLGKTHYVLHALLDKGLVKARNFRRSNRRLAYAYVLTPRGLTEKLRLMQAFLARKEAEFDVLQQTIASLRNELGSQGDGPPAGRPAAGSTRAAD
jgi:EPS-associated MarR family transcriptional regulator